MIEKAIQVLKGCETELRGLVGEAVQAGRYDDVVWLTQRAKELGEWIESAQVTNEEAAKRSSAPRHYAAAPAKDRTDPTRARRRSKGRPGYPKFFRVGDDLIKVGWSKKKRREYTHRAPRRLVNVVAAEVASAGGNSTVIPTDRLLSVRDETGEDVPHYQTYLTLAWLRSQGLITRQGRKGYTVENPSRLADGFSEIWSRLPETEKM